MAVSSLAALGGSTLTCSVTSPLSMVPGPAPIWVGTSFGFENANSYISEILYYHSVLNFTQIYLVQAYLAEKWGMPVQTSFSAFPPIPPSPPPRPPPLAPEDQSISGFSSSLAMWLDASDASTIFQDTAGTIATDSWGQPVSYWRDKSGKGNNVVLPSGFGSAPTYNPYLLSSLHPGLDFSHNGALVTPSTYAKSVDVTLFLVGQVLRPVSNATLWGHFGTGLNSNSADISLRRSADLTAFSWLTSADFNGCALPYADGVPVLFTATLKGGTAR